MISLSTISGKVQENCGGAEGGQDEEERGWEPRDSGLALEAPGTSVRLGPGCCPRGQNEHVRSHQGAFPASALARTQHRAPHPGGAWSWGPLCTVVPAAVPQRAAARAEPRQQEAPDCRGRFLPWGTPPTQDHPPHTHTHLEEQPQGPEVISAELLTIPATVPPRRQNSSGQNPPAGSPGPTSASSRG